MGSGFRTTVLAACNSRRRVAREADGTIHVLWEAVGIRMSQSEFVEMAALVTEALGRNCRCGKLACDIHGQVLRCPMGQIMLSHDRLTLWFSPKEFEEFCRLLQKARQRLADAEPLPALGNPWTPPYEGFFAPN